jgi:hypothetical protein
MKERKEVVQSIFLGANYLFTSLHHVPHVRRAFKAPPHSRSDLSAAVNALIRLRHRHG